MQIAAQRILQSLAVDAIVLDSHHLELKWLSPPVARLLHVITVMRDREPRPPLIVLTSAGLSGDLRRACGRAESVFLPAHLQSYRQIAAVVRRLCGLVDGCCIPSDSSFNPEATFASYGRY